MNEQITKLLNEEQLSSPLPMETALLAADHLQQQTGLERVYPRSLIATDHALFFLGKATGDSNKQLGILSQDQHSTTVCQPFQGESKGSNLLLCPTDSVNAAAMRERFPFLVPKPLGLEKSAGTGDRLALATPGHIHAFRNNHNDSSVASIQPILAQQSIRENDRTGRTPQEVIDDAMWGVFQEGWRTGYGADADHLKNTDDVDVCAAAGYTFFTVDPGEYVDDEANHANQTVLETKVAALPWDILDSSPQDLADRLSGQQIDLGEFSVTLDNEALLRAAAKYGQAVAHTARMQRHLDQVMGERPYELEMSVDETETITSLTEHIYIANELQRLGIRVISLAPRYVGAFEKGVDYIGDLTAFEQSFAQHMAVAQTFGPYKLSLHSGSDKFSIYPIASRIAGSLLHLKTAGTSYLEALRTIANVKPALFREITTFAIERFPIDKASYHISAEIERMPPLAQLSDDELPTLLEDFHARQILHVTFGSVLHHPQLRPAFFTTLYQNEDVYTRTVARHFDRHFHEFR